MKNPKIGVERAPVLEPGKEPVSRRERVTMVAHERIMLHDALIRRKLKVGSAGQFVASADDMRARKEQLDESKAGSHQVGRGLHQVSQLFEGTTDAFQSEMAKKRMLDIGCGEGVFGSDLARRAKTRVTFVDQDPSALDKIHRTAGRRVIADGTELPFGDGAFDRTVSSFSTFAWSGSPVDSVRGLHEALRVTKTGGSFFAVPVFSNIEARHNLHPLEIRKREGKLKDVKSFVDPRALDVWAAQDHALINALETLQAERLCAITWCARMSIGQTTNKEMEHYSAIIDVVEPIPADVVEANMAYAASFVG